jgi:hypothetical protein
MCWHKLLRNVENKPYVLPHFGSHKIAELEYNKINSNPCGKRFASNGQAGEWPAFAGKPSGIS